VVSDDDDDDTFSTYDEHGDDDHDHNNDDGVVDVIREADDAGDGDTSTVVSYSSRSIDDSLLDESTTENIHSFAPHAQDGHDTTFENLL